MEICKLLGSLLLVTIVCLFVCLFGGVNPESPYSASPWEIWAYFLYWLIERTPPFVGVSYLIKNPEEDLQVLD